MQSSLFPPQYSEEFIPKKSILTSQKNINPDRELCDFILTVRLRDEVQPNPNGGFMWRQVKVSGAMKISAFQDKILAPALGWVRNYHGYIFIDSKDGAQYGPPHATVSFSMPVVIVAGI